VIVLDDCVSENGFLTPTQKKIKRAVIDKAYEESIRPDWYREEKKVLLHGGWM